MPCALLAAHRFFKAAESAFLQAALLCVFGRPVPDSADACVPFAAILFATPARMLASPCRLNFRLPLLGPADPVDAVVWAAAPSIPPSSFCSDWIFSKRSAACRSCCGVKLVSSFMNWVCDQRWHEVKLVPMQRCSGALPLRRRYRRQTRGFGRTFWKLGRASGPR